MPRIPTEGLKQAAELTGYEQAYLFKCPESRLRD